MSRRILCLTGTSRKHICCGRWSDALGIRIVKPHELFSGIPNPDQTSQINYLIESRVQELLTATVVQFPSNVTAFNYYASNSTSVQSASIGDLYQLPYNAQGEFYSCAGAPLPITVATYPQCANMRFLRVTNSGTIVGGYGAGDACCSLEHDVYAVIVYPISKGGVYSIQGDLTRLSTLGSWSNHLLVFAQDPNGTMFPEVVDTYLDTSVFAVGDDAPFEGSFGYLGSGANILIAMGPDGQLSGDASTIAFTVQSGVV